MIATPEGNDVEAQVFDAVVVGCAEHYIQGYPARALRLYAWYYTLEFGSTRLDPCWVNMHLLDSVSIYKVEAAASIHKDSGQMKAVNDGVKDQGRRAAMADTGRVVSSIKCDRYFRPRVILGFCGLHDIYLAERMLPLLSGDVCSVDHVYILSPREGIAFGRHCSARAGLYPHHCVAAGLALALVLGRDLPGLLDNPAIPVGVGGRLLRVSVDGAGLIQDLIQL